MNCEKAQLNQMTHGKTQLVQNISKRQIKSNDPWKSSIDSKNHNKTKIKSNDMWKSSIKSKKIMTVFKQNQMTRGNH